jgi:DNA-binding transcriptional LysR family regulator
MPELAVLDLLVSVAETGSLGRAAARHGISQPAASLRLQRLERQLGLRLLVRSTTGSQLTPAGEAVVDWARRILDEADRFAVALEALRDRAADRLQVAASLTIADSLFPRWLSVLHEHDPAATVSLRVANSTAVAGLVHDRAVSIGFTEGPDPPRGLHSRTVGGDELVVVVHPGHPWARRRSPLPISALAAERLVVREPGSGTRDALERALSAAGLSLRTGVELGSTTALKSAAMAGEGPAVLSALAVTAEVAEGRLHIVRVSGADFRRSFRAIWRPDAPPFGAAAALLAIAVRRGRARLVHP